MRGWRSVVGALTSVAALAVTVGGCAGSAGSGSTAGGPRIGFGGLIPVAQRGRPVVLAGRLLGGGRLSVGSWRGDVVVVNFWASWCGPCQQETTTLQRTYLATAPLGVRFLGVDEADRASTARSFRGGHRVTYPSLVDPAESVLARFPQLPSALPSSLLLDRSGRLAGVWIGPVSNPQLLAAVRTLAGAAG